jgi:hypothetical protein
MDAQGLLEETPQEEKETDLKLTKLSDDINVEALGNKDRDADSELEEDSEGCSPSWEVTKCSSLELDLM